MQNVLSQRLTKIKPTSNISRRVRPICDRAKYKANELRGMLLYYLTYSLTGLLAKRYIEHFKLLSSAIHTLLLENVSIESIDSAELKLEQFVNEFEDLYGKKNVTMNVHLLRHIANAVRHNSPLWAQSTFGFETNNGVLARVTANTNILYSIAWKYIARSSIHKNNNDKKSETALEGKQNITISESERNFLKEFCIPNTDLTLFTIYKSAIYKGDKFTSMKSRIVSTVDYVIRAIDGTIGAIKYFFFFNQSAYALIDIITTIKKSDHLTEVQCSGTYQVIMLNQIKQKLLYMKIAHKEIVTTIPNMYEKT